MLQQGFVVMGRRGTGDVAEGAMKIPKGRGSRMSQPNQISLETGKVLFTAMCVRQDVGVHYGIQS